MVHARDDDVRPRATGGRGSAPCRRRRWACRPPRTSAAPTSIMRSGRWSEMACDEADCSRSGATTQTSSPSKAAASARSPARVDAVVVREEDAHARESTNRPPRLLLAEPLELGGERLGEPPASRVPSARGQAPERAADRRLDGAGAERRRARAPRRSARAGRGARRSGSGAADDEAAPLEPLQDAGERARVEVEDLRTTSPGGDAGEAPDDAHDEPLRRGDAERRLHPLRGGLERVVERPERPHEVEHGAEASHRAISPRNRPARHVLAPRSVRAGSGRRIGPAAPRRSRGTGHRAADRISGGAGGATCPSPSARAPSPRAPRSRCATPARATTLSPPLAWTGVPAGTKSLALIVDDPDAPDPAAPKMTWVHWVLYDLPPTAAGLAGGASARRAAAGHARGQRTTGSARAGAAPARPSAGTATSSSSTRSTRRSATSARPTKAKLEKAMEGHVLAEAQLMGTYQKKRM